MLSKSKRLEYKLRLNDLWKEVTYFWRNATWEVKSPRFWADLKFNLFKRRSFQKMRTECIAKQGASWGERYRTNKPKYLDGFPNTPEYDEVRAECRQYTDLLPRVGR